MNAQELRIGNLLNAGTVKAISETDNEVILYDGLTSWRSSVMAEYWLQGIPITPDLLDKLGFERYVHFDMSDGNWRMNVSKSYFPNYFLIDWLHGSFIARCGFGVDIVYLHQLQNLYFAITGQELIYKP